MPPRRGLGRQMLATMDDITALMGATTDPTRLRELMGQYMKLHKELGRLVEANLDAASAQYAAATRGLADASATIRRAIKGIESIAQAIQLVANAVELVAKVK